MIRFVSLGPGDPELITVKALKALQSARVVYCPATCEQEGTLQSRAAQIIGQLPIPREVELRLFPVPMLSDRQAARRAYEQVCRELMREQETHPDICVACEGDAGFYATVHYIYEKLKQDGVSVELIAGVPSFIAAGARAGLHVGHGRRRIGVIPGTARAAEMEERLRQGETLVVMKASRCADEIRRLISLHPEHSYHYFERVGYPDELYTHDVEQIIGAGFPYFSLLIIQ